MNNIIQRLNYLEIPVCLFFNRINHLSMISAFFAVISRLGNGLIWYSIMLALPLIYGESGLQASLHMAVVGLVGLIIYKVMKSSTHRIRPYQLDHNIFKSVAALDKFSFPSGHTLHAVGFSMVLMVYFPQWSIFLIPFTILIALSRLVLGLHYPSDVLFGTIIGFSIAKLSFYLFPLAA